MAILERSSLPDNKSKLKTDRYPQSRAFSRAVADFNEFEELFGKWGGKFNQMSRGKFSGRLRLAAGQSIRVFEAETGQSVLTRGIDSVPFVTFVPVTPRNQLTLWRGRQLSHGQIIVKGADVEYFNQTRRDTTIQALLLPAAAVYDAFSVLTGSEMRRDLNSWYALRPPPQAMRQLLAMANTLLSRAICSPGFLDSRDGCVVQQECIRSLVATLQAAEPERYRPLHFAGQASLVRSATSYLQNRLHEPLSTLELCLATGASDRTLRRAFGKAYGMGPIAYHRVMRLNAARKELKRSRGREQSVADIARRKGFTRLGPFAAEYRRHFGELPSETLGMRG